MPWGLQLAVSAVLFAAPLPAMAQADDHLVLNGETVLRTRSAVLPTLIPIQSAAGSRSSSIPSSFPARLCRI